MGGASLAVLLLTRGEVGLLVVLYSINVFITFSLSQVGMVRHWWQVRLEDPSWWWRMGVNAVGFGLTFSILITLAWVKFFSGGWVTLLMTTALVVVAFAVRRHYEGVRKQPSGSLTVHNTTCVPGAGTTRLLRKLFLRLSAKSPLPVPPLSSCERVTTEDGACSAAGSAAWCLFRSAFSTRATSRDPTKSSGCGRT